MAKKKGFFSRFRLVYRSSPILLKCAVLVAIVISVAALTVLRINIDRESQKLDTIRVQAAQQKQQNSNLNTMIQQKDTVDGIKAIAREKLDKVDRDTELYDVVTNQD